MGLYKGGYIYVEPGGAYKLIIQVFLGFVKSHGNILKKMYMRIQFKSVYVKSCDRLQVLIGCNV